jgi:hypothetical protein
VSSKGLLRLASALTFIQGLAHGALVFTFHPTHGPDEAAVIAAMRAHTFDFGGFHHTYWQMYYGYELFVVVTCFVQAALLYFLGELSAHHPRRTEPLILIFILANVGYAILMGRFFFLPPLVFDILIAITLSAALIFCHREASK